jgi:hypothetical protein
MCVWPALISMVPGREERSRRLYYDGRDAGKRDIAASDILSTIRVAQLQKSRRWRFGVERHRAVWILTALIVTAGLCRRQADFLAAEAPHETKARDAVESEETTRLIKAELPNWEFWKGTDRKSGLKLEPKSVLRWTNPGTGRVYGDLYLRTADGRPEVVMSLFKAWDPADGFHAEMHSLSHITRRKSGASIAPTSRTGFTTPTC